MMYQSRHEALAGGGAAAGRLTAVPAVAALPAVAGMHAPHASTRYERWVKPCIDRVLAAVLLLALSPVLLAVAAAVWRELGAPIILRQRRVGLGGSAFTVYKFRTMRPCRRLQPLDWIAGERRVIHKHPQDPRLTPVGRFLRAWSLDELPQLFNVLKGDLSLVGPRPELVDIVARYEDWQHRRHQVRPGVTGLWQVSARGDGLMHEHVDIDLRYAERVSLLQDLKILLLTIPAVLGMRRGY
ncbi:MAG: sugar transferase [Euzebyales bacterium]|nr:sugar transferase [Euzebyales bacterium]